MHHLTIHLPSNFGDESSRVYYIGLRGEWTAAHHHGVTICTYESAPNVSDHKDNIFNVVSHQDQWNCILLSLFWLSVLLVLLIMRGIYPWFIVGAYFSEIEFSTEKKLYEDIKNSIVIHFHWRYFIPTNREFKRHSVDLSHFYWIQMNLYKYGKLLISQCNSYVHGIYGIHNSSVASRSDITNLCLL